MEKYSKWRDPGSGIHPFLPVKRQESNAVAEVSDGYVLLNNYVLGPLLGTLKLILLLPWLIIWFSLAWICVGMLKVPFGVLRGIDIVFGRVALVLMSFYRTASRKRMIIRSAIPALARQYENFSLHSERVNANPDGIQAGDWIVSNLSSYCDLIYNWYWYSGLVGLVDGKGEVRVCGNRFLVFYYLFLSVVGEDKNNNNNNNDFSCHPRLASISDSPYPIIIFPEGVSSNGRGVLKFIANLSSTRRNQRIHLTCSKFQSALFNPTNPGPQNFIDLFLHLWRLCSQLENSIVSRTILPASLFASSFDLPLAGENPQQFNRTLQQIVAALGHLRPLTMQASDKASFFKSFKE